MGEAPHLHVDFHPWILKDSNCLQAKVYKQYKDDKIPIVILGNDCHECPFYDALDSCWH